jgi:hypothetical protein
MVYYGLTFSSQSQRKGCGACLLALAAILTSLFLLSQDREDGIITSNLIAPVFCENPDVWLLLVTKCIYDMACVHYQIQSIFIWVLPDMGMTVCFLVLHAVFAMNNNKSEDDSSPFYSEQDQSTLFFGMGCFIMFNAIVRFICYRRMILAIELDEEHEEVKKSAIDEDDEQSPARYELLIV